MSILHLPTFLLFTLSSGNIVEGNNLNETLNSCLNLNSVLSNSFKSYPIETDHGQINGTGKVSFYYRNQDSGFRGICSNAQFSVEGSSLTGTLKGQHYIFLWSKEFNAQSSELSLDKIQYQLNTPENIEQWLNKKI